MNKIKESSYKELADSLPQIIFEMDLNGKFNFVNRHAFEVFGYTQEDFDNGLYVLQMILPEEQEKALQAIQRVISGKSTGYEYTMLRKDGTTFPGLVHSSPIIHDGNVVGLRGIVIDMTEQKKAEESLIQQHNILRQLIDNIPDQIFIKDRQSRFITANAEVLKSFGISLDDLIGKTDFDIIPYENAKELFNEEQRIMESGIGYVNFEYSFFDASGMKRWYSSTKLPLRDTNDEVIGLVGSNRDITGVKRAEESLYESEETLRVIFDSVNDAIFVHDENGKVINVNKRMLDMYKVNFSEALNFTIFDYSDASNPLDQVFSIWKMVLSGQNQLFEWKAKRPIDGTIFDVEVFLTKLVMKEQSYVLASVRDITDRKRAEMDRLNLQKLEALGLLAGGIAHDFNNLLTIILGNTSIALNNIKGDAVRDYLIKTEQAVKQSIGLTKQLLTFAKGGTPIKRVVLINDILRETTEFCLTGSEITAEYQIDKQWLVEADPDQMAQVIQNIVINAKQAMPKGGKLMIKAENATEIDNTKYLKISIKDSGIGIPEDYLDRIFDPYFSTKQSGSGLGLAVCYSIIQKHGGRMFVESKLGVGTTMNIILPAIEIENPELAIEQKANLTDQKGKILIMDDEELIREMLISMLEINGHKALASKNGNEAIILYKQAIEAGEMFDLVIMDLTIPGGMGGKDAIKEILTIDPDAKVIVSSGYSEDDIMANPLEYGFVGAIAKPYNIKQLNETVASILGKNKTI